MSTCAGHRAVLALLLAVFGAQTTLPHDCSAAPTGHSVLETDAGHGLVVTVDSATECLLCRMPSRPRAAPLAPASAADLAPEPRIPIVAATLQARQGLDLRTGSSPRAPPPFPPFV